MTGTETTQRRPAGSFAFRIRMPLTFKILIPVLALSLLGAFFHFIIQYNAIENRERHELANRMELFLQIQAAQLSEAVWTFNQEAIERLFSSYRPYADILEATLYNGDGSPAGHARGISALRFDHTFSLSIPLERVVNGETFNLGRFEVVYHDGNLKAQAASRLEADLKTLMLLLVLLTAACVLVVHFTVGAPLGRLKRSLDRNAQTGAFEPLPWGSNDELGDVVKSYNQMLGELLHSKERAESACKAKSIFLANMSHEVRTPINAVLGLSDLALRRGPDGEVKRCLELILQSSRDLLALVNDILDFSKLDAGKEAVKCVAFDPRKLVADLAATFGAQAEVKGLSFEASVDPDVPAGLVCDPTKLRVVLANLLSNAVKFTRKGGVKISVGYDQGVAVFEAADTGVGVPEDKLEVIFESFRQVDESTRREFGGTGLGLSICRKLVNLLGGTIVAASRPGQGSVFTVRLPMPPGEAPENGDDAQAAELKAAEDLPPLRVLLAEDHAVSREVLTSFLEGLGHTVIGAENGAQALDLLKKHDVDVALMDGMMPVMDGLRAAREIRSGACGLDKAKTPIVAVTALAMDGDQALFMEAGVDEYITKPVEFDKVLLALAHCVAGRGAVLRAPVSGRAEEGGPAVSAGPAPEAAASPAAEAPAPVLDRAAALARLKGMEPLLAAMERSFLDSTPAELEELGRAAQAGDQASVRLLAHRLKGNGAGVGALRFSQAALEMETAARNGRIPSPVEVEALGRLFKTAALAIPAASPSAGGGAV